MRISNFEQALDSLHSGKLGVRPFVVCADGEKIFPEYSLVEEPKYQTAHLVTEYKGVFRDSLQLFYKEGEILGKRMFENLNNEAFHLCELGIELSGITYGQTPKDDYFYHTENPRIYEVMTFPVDYVRSESDALNSDFDFQAGNRWADPCVIGERIGASPYQPFPAILISNYQTNNGLVHGTLSQDVFFHNYLVRHEEKLVVLDILSSFKGVDALELKHGRVLVDEWYLGYTEHADNIEKIFEKYTDVLRMKLPVGYGRTESNRRSLIWGSWNDGIWRDVNEEMLLKEAKFLKENFPTVRWFQLDDGYAVYDDMAHGLGVPYEGEEGIDYNKFPNGLRHYADKIREIGLVPALWIGGFCPINTKIYQEQPQWFIDYTYRSKDTQPLDVSQPEVREYMEDALETLCRKYGFEAVKHDFWSYAFEDSQGLYKYKDHSGYEYRRWWLSVLRNNLPRDGYLQSGCDIAMGNPFLGEFCNNYRYGVDIGTGNWENVKFTFQLGIACMANHAGDLFIPNSDSIGLFPGLSRNEAMFCINYCIATHSMVEIAGKLSEVHKPEALRLLKKAACNPNNGQDVYFIDYDYRSHTNAVAEKMYFKTPHFSCEENMEALPIRTVALFNLKEEAQTYSICLKDLGLEKDAYVFTDVWNGQQCDCEEVYTTVVEPHASRLIAVNKKHGVQLLDANIRIHSTSVTEGRLCLETDYAMTDAELLCHDVPSKLYYNGRIMDFAVVEGNAIRFDLPGKGTLEVHF